MLTNEPIRNHKSVIAKNVIFTSAIVVLTFIWAVADHPLVTLGIMAILIGGTSVLYYIYWAKTLITITDDDIIVERNTVFKTKKTIPYRKIASINADRDLIDRIFDTTKLKVNINSSRNATVPEVVLTFGKTFADEVRSELSRRIFNQTFDKEQYDAAESAVKFTNRDVVLHGLISLSTYQTIMTILLLAYSVTIVFFTEANLTGVAIALMLVVFMEVFPMFFLIIRYYNFKVFRTGDTIHLQHGAIQNYHSSFEIHRVNAVRIKRTLFARLMKKAYIEAEVVGIAGGNDGKIRPMISILSKEENIGTIMREILPEFVYEREPMKQPSAARAPMIVNNAVVAAVILCVLVAVFWFTAGPLDEPGISKLWHDAVTYGLIAMMALTVMVAAFNIPLSLRRLEFDMGDDLFTFKRGIVDQETVTMNYDKVQIIEIRSGLPAKRKGLAKCSASVLSATGGQRISSGFFPEEELAKVADVMLERVNTRLGKSE